MTQENHTAANENKTTREQAGQTQQNNQEELERLRKMKYQATTIQQSWVDKFTPEETRRYRFVYDERTQYKLKHFGENDKTGRMLFHFYVRDLDNPDQVKYGTEQEFLLSKTHAIAILDEFEKGHYDLEITRHGTTNRDTRYEVKPIITATTTNTTPEAPA